MNAPEGKKIGLTEVRITPQKFMAVRDRVRTMGGLSYEEKVNCLMAEFPEFSRYSVQGMIGPSKLSDEVVDLYTTGKISYIVLEDLGQGLDPEVSEFLAKEFVERKMTKSQLSMAKSLMKRKVVRSWDEALKRATKEILPEIVIPGERRHVRADPTQSPKSFDELISSLLTEGTKWRMKVDMAIKLAPFNPEDGRHHFSVFNKLYMMRHILREQYEFVDKRVGEYLDALMGKKEKSDRPLTDERHDTDIVDADFTAKETMDDYGSGGKGGPSEGNGIGSP